MKKTNPMSMVNVITTLANEGLELISTNTQIKHGTLIFNDTIQKNYLYGIYGESGYVRKMNKNKKSLPGRWNCDERWYQLNKVKKVPMKASFHRYYTERIKTPNDYEGMCETILRVVKKSRK